MKRHLYATTAICAVSLLDAQAARAEGIELGLGGYSIKLISAGGLNTTGSRDTPSDDPDYNATGLWAKDKIYFYGEYVADNGFQFGARVEYNAYDGADIDKHFVWVESDFGRVEAGSRESAAYQMHYAAPAVGLVLNSGWVTVFVPANPDSVTSSRTVAVSTYVDFGKKENTLTYYTPRIEGFQLGLSYAPAVSLSGDGQNFPAEADRNTQYYNGFAAGLNFENDVAGVGVALSLGYTRAEAPSDVLALGGDDYQGIALGATASYAGVTVGGSYANQFDGTASINGSGTALSRVIEGQAWDVGVSYGAGPWTFGASYFQSAVEGAPAGTAGVVGSGNDDKLYAAVGGIQYALGPGINAIGGVMYGRWSAESGAVNTGVVAAGGFRFNF